MEAPFDATKSKVDLLNFSGSASDMMAAMAAAGVVASDAEQAAKKVASAPASVAKASCGDPSCTVDHSHGGHDHKGHDHGHEHGHDHACTDPSHDHDHKGHDHKGHDHQGHDHKEHDHKGHGHSSSSSNGIVVHKTGFKTGVGSGHADPNHVHESTSAASMAHGHSHEHLEHPGHFSARPTAHHGRSQASYKERAFTVGIGGPVGSGKTACLLSLCRAMRNDQSLSIAAVTNDIFTKEDAEFMVKHDALEPARIRAVETGGCPHAAIREDVSANLEAVEGLTAMHGADIVFVESGGDNLAANFSRELADFTVYVIDVAGGDKVPRKGGPGITQSDLLVINKTDLAEAVGSDLKVMDRDAKMMRGDGPTLFCQVKHNVGIPEMIELITEAYRAAAAKAAGQRVEEPSTKRTKH